MQEDFKVSLMQAIAIRMAKSNGSEVDLNKGIEDTIKFLKGVSEGIIRDSWFTHTMMIALDKTRGTQTFNERFQRYANESIYPFEESFVSAFEVSDDRLLARTPDGNWLLFFESGRLLISSPIHGEYVLEDMNSINGKRHYLNVYKNHTDVFAAPEVTALIAMSLILN